MLGRRDLIRAAGRERWLAGDEPISRAIAIEVPSGSAPPAPQQVTHRAMPVDASDEEILYEAPDAEPAQSARRGPLAEPEIAAALEGKSPQPLASPLHFHIQAIAADGRVEDHVSFFVPEQSYVDRSTLYRVMSSFLHATIFDERMGFCTRIAMEQDGMWHDVTQSVTDLTHRCITGEDIRIGSPSDIAGRILKLVTLEREKAADDPAHRNGIGIGECLLG
jgi:hypothetical protein